MGVLDNTLEARVEALEAELAAIRGVPRRPRSRPAESAGTARTQHDAGGSAGLRSPRRRQAARGRALWARSPAAALTAQPAAADRWPGDRPGTVQRRPRRSTWIYASDDTALCLRVRRRLRTRGAGVRPATPGSSRSTDSPLGQPAAYAARCGSTTTATGGRRRARRRRRASGASSPGPGRRARCTCSRSPKRVYDSRPGEPPAIDPKTPLDAERRRGRSIPRPNSSGVPAQARGVLITLTVTALAAGGFATVWPSGAWPGTSNINFNAEPERSRRRRSSVSGRTPHSSSSRTCRRTS